VADLTSANALDVLESVDLILDGTDNFETRYLLNDAAVKLGVPWIYGAAVGSYGLKLTVVPGPHRMLEVRLSRAPQRPAANL
jgi:adenylyltransferase/sulfurtransferase